MRLRKTFVSIAILAISAGAALCEESSQVTCEGKVVDVSGKAISGAEVVAYKQTLHSSEGRIELKLLGKLVTKGDGRFSFTCHRSESPGEVCIIAARSPGLALGWVNWQMTGDRTADIRLGEPAILGGWVSGEDIEKVSGAEVRVVLRRLTDRGESELPGIAPCDWLLTSTDSRGQFRYTNIPLDARATLLVSAPSVARMHTGSIFIGERGGVPAGETKWRVWLRRPGGIRGTLIDRENRRPIKGVRLVFEKKARPLAFAPFSAVSGTDGTFAVSGLQPGDYYVRVSRAPGKPLEWATFPLKLYVAPGGTGEPVVLELLDGAVLEVIARDVDTKQPIRGAWVMIAPKGSIFSPHHAYTGEDGAARIHLLPGQYYLDYVQERYRYSKADVSRNVTITEGQTERITVQAELKKLPVLRGLVRGPGGEPVAGAEVFVVPGSPYVSHTNSAGGFEITWDPARVTDDEKQIVMAREVGRGLAGATEVRPDPMVEIELRQGATARGKVVDSHETPLEEFNVRLNFWTGRMWYPTNIARPAVDKGRYEVRAIPVGWKYRLYACAEGYVAKQVELDLTKTDAGYVKHVDFALEPADNKISGIVVDKAGKPVSDASVMAMVEIFPSVFSAADAITNADGEFTLTDLPPGEARIYVECPQKRLFARTNARAGDERVTITVREPPGPDPSLIEMPDWMKEAEKRDRKK